MKYFVLCVTLNLLFFANIVSTAVQIAPVYSDTSLNLTIFNHKYPFQVSCKVTADTSDAVEIRWEKDGKPISKVAALNNRWSDKQKGDLYTLNIEHSTEDDAGNYSCAAYVGNEEKARAYIQTTCAIKIKIPGNVNVVEGEKLRIVCMVFGKPAPEISWTVLNETYTESRGRVKLLPDPDKNLTNSILLIEDIQMSDRGIYKCIAVSNLTKKEESDSTMVRVKDKYAALWPFLGICAEVFVLCAIILVYEKKRNKTELEESDTDQSPDQKNTPDHGKEVNLRHRQ